LKYISENRSKGEHTHTHKHTHHKRYSLKLETACNQLKEVRAKMQHQGQQVAEQYHQSCMEKMELLERSVI